MLSNSYSFIKYSSSCVFLSCVSIKWVSSKIHIKTAWLNPLKFEKDLDRHRIGVLTHKGGGKVALPIKLPIGRGSTRLRQTWWRQQQMKAAQSVCRLMRRGQCWVAWVYDISAIFDGRLQWNPHHQIPRATSPPRCAPFPCNGTCLFQWTTFKYLHSSRECERTPKDISFCKRNVYILCLSATASRPFVNVWQEECRMNQEGTCIRGTIWANFTNKS